MSSDKQILEKAIQKAIDGGWNLKTWPSERYWPNYLSDEHLVRHAAETLNDMRLEHLIFNHDFAKALWGENRKPPESEDIDENNTKLGLYAARGGGYEGYGDYVELEFTGDAWQYHLQNMVIADNPIKYLGENL